MPKPKNNRKNSRAGDYVQRKQCQLIDDLMDFEEFRDEILPMLRADLKNKTPTKEMRKKYLALLTARAITIGLREPDSAKALSAIKDIVDRDEGRATEHKVVDHRLKDVSDTELDAVLQSEIEDLKESLLTN